MEKKKKGTPEKWQPNYMIDEDTWMAPYFDPLDTSARNARRADFAGPIAL